MPNYPFVDHYLARIEEGWDDLKPYGCSRCPFATELGEADGEFPPNFADLDEGYYKCALLNLPKVWGESPKCTEKLWTDRFVAEIRQLRDLQEPQPDPGSAVLGGSDRPS